MWSVFKRIFMPLSVVYTPLLLASSIEAPVSREPYHNEQLKIVSNDSQSDGDVTVNALQQLMNVIEETTEIATKNRINADWVPGMVSVLRGEELEARGIFSVLEALTLIPGIAPTDIEHGDVMFRGIALHISSKVKILVDNVTITDFAVAGLGAPVMAMPIEMVERIDVIRGPGSSLYGGYAFSGVINVITRKNQQRLFSRIDDFNTRAAGLVLSHQANDWQVNLNLSSGRSDGDDVLAGEDFIARSFPELTISPGETNESSRYKGAFLEFEQEDFNLKAQFSHRGSTIPFGFSLILPPDLQKVTQEIERYTFETSKSWQLSNNLAVLGKLGVYRVNARFIDEHNTPMPLGARPFLGNWGIFSAYVREDKQYAQVELDWQLNQKHFVTTTLDYSNADISEAWIESNTDQFGVPRRQFIREEGDIGLFRKGDKRRVYAVSIQDQFKFSDSLSFTTGARYDHYSDVGSSLAPRLAAVYAADEEHLIKIQYGEAFRPPTTAEWVFNDNGKNTIASETIQTWELGYINRGPDYVGRITGFKSKIEDLITVFSVAPDIVYYNAPSVDAMGIEAEFEYKYSDHLKFDGNFSWVETEHLELGQAVAGTPKGLVNLGILWQPLLDLQLNLRYQRLGKRHREIQDTRAPLSSNNQTSINLSYGNVLTSGLTIRFSVKNVFDQTVKQPAPVNTYLEDFPRYGRRVSVGMSYDF